MNKEFHIQQLVSYVSGNCSDEEQMAVELWMQLSEDNMMLYDEYRLVWDSTSARNTSKLIDIDSRWEDFKVRTDFSPVENLIPGTKKSSFSRRLLYNFSQVAAALVVLFGLYFIFNNEKTIESVLYTASSTQSANPVLLADGTEVNINSGSEISCPSEFSSEFRKIELLGEAFFNVAHNADKPMIIATGDVRVKVLGTSFNLCNCANSNEIIVYLETGKILFYSVDNSNGKILEQVILAPGEKGVYNKVTGLITKSVFTDNNHIGWKTGIMNFVNMPLSDVINVIENTYNVEVETELSLNEYYLTARYESESPESILKSWQIIYGFEYNIEDNKISLH
jgi:transmembrane sensor